MPPLFYIIFSDVITFYVKLFNSFKIAQTVLSLWTSNFEAIKNVFTLIFTRKLSLTSWQNSDPPLNSDLNSKAF